MGKAYKTETLTNLIWKMEDEGITVRELVDHFPQCFEPYMMAAQFLNGLNAIDAMCSASDGMSEGPIAFYPKWFEERDVDDLLDEVHYVRTYIDDAGKCALAIESITSHLFIKLVDVDLIVLKYIYPQSESTIPSKEVDVEDILPLCPRCGGWAGEHLSTCALFAR